MHTGQVNNAKKQWWWKAGLVSLDSDSHFPALSPALSLMPWLAHREEPGQKLGCQRPSSEIVISAGFLGNSWKVPEMTFLT